MRHSRVDNFTAAANGVPADCSRDPVKNVSLQVKCVGAAATAWNIVLEGSNDGVNWTVLITHTQADTDGNTKFQASGIVTPVLYLRTRMASVTLGSATSINATLLGV